MIVLIVPRLTTEHKRHAHNVMWWMFQSNHIQLITLIYYELYLNNEIHKYTGGFFMRISLQYTSSNVIKIQIMLRRPFDRLPQVPRRLCLESWNETCQFVSSSVFIDIYIAIYYETGGYIASTGCVNYANMLVIDSLWCSTIGFLVSSKLVPIDAPCFSKKGGVCLGNWIQPAPSFCFIFYVILCYMLEHVITKLNWVVCFCEVCDPAAKMIISRQQINRYFSKLGYRWC